MTIIPARDIHFPPVQKLAFDERLQLSLLQGVTLRKQADDSLAVVSPFGALTFKRLTPGLQAAFMTLAAGGSTFDTLSESVLHRDGPGALTRFHYHVDQLLVRGLIQHTVLEGETPLATIQAVGQQYRFAHYDLDEAQSYVLSRFAYCRRVGEEMVLECPLGHAQILLHNWRTAALVTVLAKPHTIFQLSAQLHGLSAESIVGCLQLLWNAAALTTQPEDSPSAEDDQATLVQWDFHDLLFHNHSRYGRHANPFGATFRHIDRIQPLPAVRPAHSGDTIDLYHPDLAALQANDPPLAQVMEMRKSVYTYGEQPITLQQLGEFLYRVARVRSLEETLVKSAYVPGQARMQVSSRPYPAGGKCYELEFYVTVDCCQKLEGGLYHYDPLHHRLTRLRERDEYVQSLLRYASVAAPQGRPQILITLAARFQRMSWKYDAIAYATILKHVGVVYQSLYLAATAMGLGPCALGSGDSDLFAAAIGTDYLAETSVGEFMLGSLPRAEESV